MQILWCGAGEVLGLGRAKRAEGSQLCLYIMGEFTARKENRYWYFAVIFEEVKVCLLCQTIAFHVSALVVAVLAFDLPWQGRENILHVGFETYGARLGHERNRRSWLRSNSMGSSVNTEGEALAGVTGHEERARVMEGALWLGTSSVLV